MFVTDETQEHSPYWLSPGIDLPTREEILPGMRSAKGLFHTCDKHAEGAFVPTDAFMRNSPTWRLDVLGNILIDLQRAQQHAAVELFRELSRKSPEVGLERQLRGVRHACEKLGLVLPENVEALMVLDRQFIAEHV
ncbi:MAG: hypothetical protein KIS83_08950 [Rubrivivax sp.]|nr:hypothetical protein [Rubrivivax sp.]